MIGSNDVSINCRIEQCPGNLVSDMDGEKVMLSVMNGKYYNLGEIGGEIWDLIEQPNSISQIVENLLSNYQVEKSECEEQVISFLNLLLDQNLVQIKEY